MEEVRHPHTMRRVAAGVALTVASVLLVALLTSDLFSRADAGEAATDLVRSELTVEGVTQHRADFELTKSATDQLIDVAMPAVGDVLGLSAAQLNNRYPSIAAAGAQRSTIYPFAEKIVANLERHQANFAAADDIPLAGLPMTAAPPIAVFAIVVLIACALLTLLRRGRVWLVALAGYALLIIVAPFATGYPDKATKAADVLDSLNVSHELAAQTRAHFDTMVAASVEFEQKTVPDLLAATGGSRSRLDQQLASEFPAVAEGRQQFAAVFRRYDERVSIRERGVDRVNEAKRFPLEAVTWWTVVAGAVVLAAAAVALEYERRLGLIR
ncbi:MAG: hypothetical protein ABIQ73_04245 [Acidimicrobiales bacterium]